jgi:adenosylcobyric acid synthase
VPQFARIANFDDLDPLMAEGDVEVEIVPPGRALPGDADLIILPGSKSTIADLAQLRSEGWDIDIAAHLRRGGFVLGICAGYQMLGRTLADPAGIEGSAGSVAGLGLLDLSTEMTGDKQLTAASGRHMASDTAMQGYEMHIGRTSGPAAERPFMIFTGGRPDGAQTPDGRIAGCYLHGLFASDAFRHAYLSAIRQRTVSGLAYEAMVDGVLDRLAAHCAAHLDLARILKVARAR